MKNFQERKFILLAIFLVTGVIYLIRLLYIQVINDDYKLSANNQTLDYVTQYPVRGIILDRNGKYLVYNEVAYDLMVVPKDVQEMDTLKFCAMIGIEKTQFDERLAEAKAYSWHKASVMEAQIDADEYSSIAEKLYQFPGFVGEQRILRRYPDSIAAHVLGYIGEVSPTMLADTGDINKDGYYQSRDYIGINGLERSYETIIRGQKGVKIYMKDVHNVRQGSFKNGRYDTLAVDGVNLTATLDAELQKHGEQLMLNKRGSIVAIEPATGEILALVSAPSYDPNLLVGRVRTENYQDLVNNDSLDPLFNRALMAKYPPGSIFKMVEAMVGLQEQVITPESGFPCNKSLVGCHNHPTATDVTKAIQFSCNPYFRTLGKRLIQRGTEKSIFKDAPIGLANWQHNIKSFGLGQRLPVDLPSLKSGTIPGPDYYDRIYGEGSWAYSTIYSISIGQGEVEVIPLQMANIAAIFANRGYYYTPHLVREIGKDGDKLDLYKKKNRTTVGGEYFELAAEAMRRVVEEPGGTARRARTKDITVCGKTGTAENPHGEDHSVFISFAPKDNPKIAIAVYVENAGFGGTWAAPIASLMIEKYIKGEVQDSVKLKRILEADLMNVEKR